MSVLIIVFDDYLFLELKVFILFLRSGDVFGIFVSKRPFS